MSNFCNRLKGNTHKIEERCKKQSPDMCKTLDCCVLAMNKGDKKGQCLAGSKLGPNYHTDKSGKNIKFDYYYNQNKCYGDACPK